MSSKTGTARASISMTPEQKRRALALKDAAGASSLSRLCLDAIEVYSVAYQATRSGDVLAVVRFNDAGEVERVGRIAIPSLSGVAPEGAK